jgi:hypothetical protein
MLRRKSSPWRNRVLRGRFKVFFGGRGLGRRAAGRRCGRSTRRPGEQAHELGEALGVGKMGVLQVEATGFEAAEQGLHLPAVGVGVDGFGLGCAEGGDEQEVAVLQAQGGDVDEAAPDRGGGRAGSGFRLASASRTARPGASCGSRRWARGCCA